ncbi:MAG: hypothetical protein V3T05_14145 [Myxococcota bacterium]
MAAVPKECETRLLLQTSTMSCALHCLDPECAELVAKLRVPKREYYDWGEIGAASTKEGAVIIYSGERPDEAVETLELSKLTFRMAASVIVAVVVSNLGNCLSGCLR